MHRPLLMQQRGVQRPTSHSGHHLYGAKVTRPVVAGSTRPDWRAEIESGGTGADAAEQSSASPIGVKTRGPAMSPQPAQASSPEPQPQPPATSPREEPFSLPTVDLVELMSQPSNQSLAFTSLASISAILAVLCCIEPEAVLDLALPKAIPSGVDVTFVRIIGVTLAASASVEYSLKHAAESQLLKSATYQRLMAGLALKSAGFLAVLLATAPATFRLWSPAAWVAYVVTAVGAAGINLAVMSLTSGKGLVAPELEFKQPANAASWGYTICAGLYVLTVLACFAPEALFTGDPPSDITPLVKGVWAPGFMLAAVTSYVLKDSADRGRLGASTFKNLNLGLAALEYGYSVIFGSAILSDQVPLDAAAVSNLVGSISIATFALYTYATAKK